MATLGELKRRKAAAKLEEEEQELGLGIDLPIAEIATGVIVIAILLFVGLPKVTSWLRADHIEQAVEGVYFNLQTAQIRAIKANKDVLVVFQPASDSYSLYMDKNGNSTPEQDELLITSPLDPEIQFGTNAALGVGDVWEGKPLGSDPVVLSSGGTTLVFHSQGQVSTDAAIYLVPKEDAGVRNDLLRAIQITNSGQFRIVRYDPDASPPWR